MKRVQGFTLVELMLVLAIIAILAAAAAPSINSYMDSRRVVSAAEAIYSQLLYARSEAIARSTPVGVTIYPGDSATWKLGISTNIPCNPTQPDDTAADACVLDVNGTNVFKRLFGTDYSKITIGGLNNPHTFTFDPIRGTASGNDTVEVTLGSMELNVVVAPVGRVKVCSPDGSGRSYKGC